MMKIELLDEPELQFSEGTHIDIRAGLTLYKPLEYNSQTIHNPIRVGIVGTKETIDGVSRWLRWCQKGVASQEKKLVYLRPDFPGMTAPVVAPSMGMG